MYFHTCQFKELAKVLSKAIGTKQLSESVRGEGSHGAPGRRKKKGSVTNYLEASTHRCIFAAPRSDGARNSQKGAFSFHRDGVCWLAPRKVPMLDITKDIQSLTTFRRRSGDFMKQLKKSKRPVVLTIKGKAAAIVQDAEAYQRLLDIAASADAVEGIRQGLDDVAHGRTRPAKDVFDDIRGKHDIPR
jgi:PHD/YefM family antitoxin component YafN of YafNO toxin-antitoxin module